jgi:hypothetical protein
MYSFASRCGRRDLLARQLGAQLPGKLFYPLELLNQCFRKNALIHLLQIGGEGV